jgi:hypothetical protein
LLDEGVSSVLDRLAEAGLNGVTMAATYHHARDVFPHNPKHKVGYREGGVAYFTTARASYGRIQPVRSTLTHACDPLEVLKQAADERGLRASAWLVVLHNSRLAHAFPDCAPRTAFGDPLLNALCPAHPDARAYAVALAQDVARYGLEAIKLEAVHYPGFDHGDHHERSFVPLSPNIRFLLGLCCCVHCMAAAQAAGVDAERVRAVCREQLERLFESTANETHETEVEDDWLRSLADGELGRYAQLRQQVVTSLVTEIATAVHQVAPTRVVYLDPSGATLGYARGMPSSERLAVSIGWRDGIDLGALSPAVDELGMIGYFRETARFVRELAAYRMLSHRLEVILRPMHPDTRSAEELADRVHAAREAGVQDLSFYHYGFMRLQNLDWIRQALA